MAERWPQTNATKGTRSSRQRAAIPNRGVKGIETFTRVDLAVSIGNATRCLAGSGTLWQPFYKDSDPQAPSPALSFGPTRSAHSSSSTRSVEGVEPDETDVSIRSWPTAEAFDPDQTADTVRHRSGGEETARVCGRGSTMADSPGRSEIANANVAASQPEHTAVGRRPSAGFATPGRDSSPPKVFRGRDEPMHPRQAADAAADLSTVPSNAAPLASVSVSAPVQEVDRGLPEVVPSRATRKHMRHDVITDRWTFLSPGREDRPMDFATREDLAVDLSSCPFCRGNEAMTPMPVWIDGVCPSQVTPGDPWSVRVVPNRFPAVESGWMDEAALHVCSSGRSAKRRSSDRLFQTRSAIGCHEVIIESDRHLRSTTDMSPAELSIVLAAYQDRLRHFADEGRLGYVSIFKNVGSEAGASLTHSHSQLVATEHVPDDVQTAFLQMDRHRCATGCCLQCDLIAAEERCGVRVVEADDDFLAFCPFASLHPMMIRITTRRHVACLSDLTTNMRQRLAGLLHRTIGRLESMLGPVAYNYVLNSRPLRQVDAGQAFHWSLDLFPRQTKVAGFEWNTGMMINPVLPESAAARYREV